jgi:small GTP-binding protein
LGRLLGSHNLHGKIFIKIYVNTHRGNQLGIPEKIKAIEAEIHKTQINKATEFHIGVLKAKIARLKREMIENKHGKTVSGGGENVGFDIRKTGDASVILVGLPSVGKSTILNSLTNAKSEVASYQFTTLTAVPGMMDFYGAKIQILDLPGIVEGASKGKGMGRRVLSVARSADLLLVVLDVFQTKHLPVLEKELSQVGIKINQTRPDVTIEETHSGGLFVHAQKPLKMSLNLAKEILRIHGLHNGRLIVREPELSYEQLIDVLSGNTLYLPSIIVVNKIDLVSKKFLTEISANMPREVVAISADKKMNIEYLKQKIYDRLNFIKVYLKPRGGQVDIKEPLVMKKECTVKDVCNKIHRNFVKDFKFAYVVGKSVKFDGQRVSLDHKLLDKDILTIVKK